MSLARRIGTFFHGFPKNLCRAVPACRAALSPFPIGTCAEREVARVAHDRVWGVP
jgi:hypothetical protein